MPAPAAMTEAGARIRTSITYSAIFLNIVSHETRHRKGGLFRFFIYNVRTEAFIGAPIGCIFISL